MPLWAGAVGIASDWSQQSGLHAGSAAFMIGLVLLVYVGALLHELGHVWAARRFGAAVVRLRFSGLGAFVQVRPPVGAPPVHEIGIALAGPAVSAALTLGLFGVVLLIGGDQASGLGSRRDLPGLVLLLAVMNGLLTIFNLLPFFPMDGGRALAALLRMTTSHPQHATRLVSVFGGIVAAGTIPLVLALTPDFLVRLWAVCTAAFIIRASVQEGRGTDD